MRFMRALGESMGQVRLSKNEAMKMMSPARKASSTKPATTTRS